MSISFPQFAFPLNPGIGANAPRTAPDRFLDIKNVKDFGAKGDGITDDSVAIQNTVNAALAVGVEPGAVVFFPPGNYLTTIPINLSGSTEQSLTIRGSGLGSRVGGSVNGYVFDRNSVGVFSQLVLIESLDVKNTNSSGGGIRLRNGSCNQVRNCRVQAQIGINIGGGNSPLDVGFDSTVFNCEVLGLASNPAAGSIGIMLGPESSVWGCGVVNFDHGIRCYGAGITIGACRIEVNNTGIMVGRDINNLSFSVSGGHIFGTGFEGNLDGIYINAAAGLVISGCVITFGSNAPPGNGNSVNGFHYFNGNNIVLIGVAITGAYTNAGTFIEGNPDPNTPAITFINVTGSFLAGGGVVLGSCEQIGCGFPNFIIPFASLPTYLVEGSRKAITNASRSGATSLVATGLSGAGAVTLTGAVVGDIVQHVYDQNAANWVDVTSSFESTISVANQIQETVSVSGHKILVMLNPVAADGAGSFHVPVYRDSGGWKIG